MIIKTLAIFGILAKDFYIYSRVPNNWGGGEGVGMMGGWKLLQKLIIGGVGTIGGGGLKNDTIFFLYQCNKEV